MKKEKYIYENSYNGRLSYLAVKFKNKEMDKEFYYSVNISDYESVEDARVAACAIRDQALLDLHYGKMVINDPTVGYLYKMKFDLFPCSLKTRQKHDYFYKYGISMYENTAISDIKSYHVQKSINDYAETHTSSMVSHLLSVWKQIFRTAQMMEIPVVDKTLMVIIPRSKVVKCPKDVTITDKDFNAFMEALEDYHSYDELGIWRSKSIWYMLQIAYYTGMRPAEIMALTKSDIDLKNGFISVSKSVGSDKTRSRAIIPTKTRTSVRKVPIAAELEVYLKEAMARCKERKYLISDKDGSLYDIDFVSNYIHLVSKACGIPFNAYRLRHKFSSDLFAAKENPRVIQDLMGHASAEMSIEYARSSEEDKKKAIEGMRNKDSSENSSEKNQKV